MKIVEDTNQQNVNIKDKDAISKDKPAAFDINDAEELSKQQQEDIISIDNIDITSEKFIEDENQANEELIKQFKTNVLEQLANLGGPTVDGLQRLVDMYGDVFIYHHDDENIFVCHPLSRQLWQKIKKGKANIIGATDQEELVFANGVIWPDPRKNQFIQTRKAGIIDTVASLIMVYSGFINLDYAMSKVIPL